MTMAMPMTNSPRARISQPTSATTNSCGVMTIARTAPHFDRLAWRIELSVHSVPRIPRVRPAPVAASPNPRYARRMDGGLWRREANNRTPPAIAARQPSWTRRSRRLGRAVFSCGFGPAGFVASADPRSTLDAAWSRRRLGSATWESVACGELDVLVPCQLLLASLAAASNSIRGRA